MEERTEIADLGEFGLIEHLTKNFEIQNASKREVKLTLELDECIGLDGQSVGGRNPHKMIEKLEAGEAKAKKYLDI
jgi:hypothetical protein